MKWMFGRDIRTELDFMVEDALIVHAHTGPNKDVKINRSFSVG